MPNKLSGKTEPLQSFGVNNVESWIGRDLDEYIPGFYWLTLITDNSADKYGFNLNQVCEESNEIAEIGKGVYLLKFFDYATEWEKYKAKLDELCKRTAGVFYKGDIETELHGVSDCLEYDDIIDRWR